MSIKRVLDAAMLSSFAHLDEEGVKKALENTDYKFIHFFDKNDVEGYIAEDGRDQVVVFRETDDKESWINNLKFLPKKFGSYGVFHRQFFKLLLGLRKEIMSKIKDKNFVCIGFSQGASLARLFAHMITKREVISGYKPFFVSFEPAMESKTNDYNEYGIYTIKGNDPVPMIPLKLTGWNHSGMLLYLTGTKGRVIVDPSRLKKALMVASDTIMDSEDGFTTEDIMRDHNVMIIYKQSWIQKKNKDKIIKVCKKFGLK